MLMFDDGFVDDTEEMMKMAMSKKPPYLSPHSLLRCFHA
jgi:hypothetical protein